MNHFSYYRHQLPPVEQRLYDAVLTGILNWEREIRFCAGTETVNTRRVEYALRFDNPEIISVDPVTPGCFRSARQNGMNHYLFTPNYLCTPREAQELMRRVRETTEPILATVKGRSELEIVRFFHDWLVIRDQYGYTEGKRQMSYSMLGAFLNNRCVCEGFSKAFKYLCDRMYLRCMAVTGYSRGPTNELSGAHSWNLVVVDGVPYQVDVTFDNHDRIADGTTCSHAYFLISTRQMQADHVFITGFSVPDCPLDHSVLPVVGTPWELASLLREEYRRRTPYTEFRPGTGVTSEQLLRGLEGVMTREDRPMLNRMGAHCSLGGGRTTLILWK